MATIVTASHQPVRLNDLIAEYEALGPELRRGGPQDSWWTSFQPRARLAGRGPSAPTGPRSNPDARYNRALQRLSTGDVDQALAETMRLPGAARAGDWVAKARRYIAAHRALDEIESAALLGGPTPRADPRKRLGKRLADAILVAAHSGSSAARAKRLQEAGSPGERLRVMTSLVEALRAWPGAARGGAGQRVGRQPAAAAGAQRAAGAASASPAAPAPHYIRDRVDELGRGFNGRVGIAVRSIDDGWATGWKADELYPQQSVSKLWVSITAMDAVDKGRVSLDDKVTLDPRRPHPVPPADRRADPRRRLHDDARRPDVQGDHDQRQYRQRQADARRSAGPRRCATMIAAQASRRDPLLQWRARAAEQDRRADLEPELFDRQCLLRRARRTARCGPQGGVRPLCRGPV